MVKKLDFETMIEECEKHKIDYYGMDRDDMFFALAGISELPEFKKVGVFKREVSEKRRERLEKKNEQIPEKTIFPIELKSKVLAIIGKSPLAFNGQDLTRDDQVSNFTFDRKVKCYCGETFTMTHKLKDGGPMNPGTGIERKENVELKLCPNVHCLKQGNKFVQRQWTFLEV